MLDFPALDYPTLEKPTLENPTQLNKDILTKEKPNTDLIKYLFPSYPFPNHFPLGCPTAKTETVVKDACAKFILDDCFWLCYLLPVKSELQDSFDKLCF